MTRSTQCKPVQLAKEACLETKLWVHRLLSHLPCNAASEDDTADDATIPAQPIPKSKPAHRCHCPLVRRQTENDLRGIFHNRSIVLTEEWTNDFGASVATASSVNNSQTTEHASTRVTGQPGTPMLKKHRRAAAVQKTVM